MIHDFFPVNFRRNSQSFEQNVDNLKGPLCGFGHTFGVRVQRGRFLGLTGLTAGGFLSLTGPLAPRVADCPSGNAYEVSVTGLAVCVICDTISSATYFLVSP